MIKIYGGHSSVWKTERADERKPWSYTPVAHPLKRVYAK